MEVLFIILGFEFIMVECFLYIKLIEYYAGYSRKNAHSITFQFFILFGLIAGQIFNTVAFGLMGGKLYTVLFEIV